LGFGVALVARAHFNSVMKPGSDHWLVQAGGVAVGGGMEGGEPGANLILGFALADELGDLRAHFHDVVAVGLESRPIRHGVVSGNHLVDLERGHGRIHRLGPLDEAAAAAVIDEGVTPAITSPVWITRCAGK
jgi:hypothetical protein